MKKLLIFVLAVLVSAVAVPAFADVTVTATIDKTKDIFIDEFIFKLKLVEIEVTVVENLTGAAEALQLANVSNYGNTVDHSDGGIDLVADIGESINNNSGIVGVNQDVGNMVNQANIVSVTVTNSSSAITEAQAEVDQENSGNSSTWNVSLGDPARTLPITNSINDNTGIVQVNQNASSMNNQTNAIALAVGLGDQVLALSEAALGQVNQDNTVVEQDTVKTVKIVNSVNGNAGIVQLNQAVGNMANQANVVAFGTAATLF